ncbi:PREDICTED: disease resistance RPP13-like protein 4 [Ipomoea nil]|uniref:disease resistance RPP13-like protein 4 n=1 Tax=Ipomoea nil TaxID=35883 RepID=UPI000901672E|nr:PREDICTED: disease resistance RPP13-like protein 4 [Ipomoea nil]
MAAFVVVSSLLELVEQQLLQPKPCLVLDDTETIVSLREKLHFLQAFLEESNLKTEDPEAKEKLETEIQDVATKAEGQIGSKLRLVYLAANANGGDQCLVEEACQRLYQTMQQVVKDIKSVEIRILMLKPNLFSSSTNDFNEENVMVGVSSPSDLIPEDTPIVGFEGEAKTIVGMLTNEWSIEREVIAICGVGGLGKITLAKSVYEDPKIKYHFDIQVPNYFQVSSFGWWLLHKRRRVEEVVSETVSGMDCDATVSKNGLEAGLAAQTRPEL